MPTYRNKRTGQVIESDRELSPAELMQRAGGTAPAPAPGQTPSLAEDLVTRVAAPTIGGIAGGQISGPFGAALGATGGQAYGDLYRALRHGPDPLSSQPASAAPPWAASIIGAGQQMRDEINRLGKTAGATLLGEAAGPALKMVGALAPSNLLRLLRGAGSGSGVGSRGAGGLVEAVGLGSMGHPILGAGGAALEAAGPVGSAIERAVTPAGTKPILGSKVLGGAKEELGGAANWATQKAKDLYDAVQAARAVRATAQGFTPPPTGSPAASARPVGAGQAAAAAGRPPVAPPPTPTASPVPTSLPPRGLPAPPPAPPPEVSVPTATAQGAAQPAAPPAPLIQSPTATAPPTPAGLAPPPVAGPEPPSELARFFRTPQGATGLNYAQAKTAEAAGEIPTAVGARGSHLLNIPGREAEGQAILGQLERSGMSGGVGTAPAAPANVLPSTPKSLEELFGIDIAPQGPRVPGGGTPTPTETMWDPWRGQRVAPKPEDIFSPAGAEARAAAAKPSTAPMATPKPLGEVRAPSVAPESPGPSTEATTGNWAQDQADIAEAADMLKKRGVNVTPDTLNFIEQLQKMGQSIK